MGYPTVILPGYFAGAAPYQTMEKTLAELGFPSVTVPLSRWDWVPTVGGRSMGGILDKLDQTVKQVMETTGSDRINLIGHSAGGWIARIYLGEIPYTIHAKDAGKPMLWKAHPSVATLMTLGTPHVSQERWTLRNLNFVNDNYPGAFHPTVRYVCVAGKAVLGDRSPAGWFTYNSYLLTCGNGTCWGDEITPISAAHLEGAENLILDQVVHSPRPGKRWYGSPDIIPTWAAYLA
ncbi:MAG: lipase [Leptolyngbya sp. DLM2.Bin15]|nr:MAG: lipase [Leptolyngbya sp. DLM2.Bin15]